MNDVLPLAFKEELTDQQEDEYKHTKYDAIPVLLEFEIHARCFWLSTEEHLRLPKASRESNRKEGEDRK